MASVAPSYSPTPTHTQLPTTTLAHERSSARRSRRATARWLTRCAASRAATAPLRTHWPRLPNPQGAGAALLRGRDPWPCARCPANLDTDCDFGSRGVWLPPSDPPRKRPVPRYVPPQTEIVEYNRGAALGLTIRGEIDIDNSPELELALDKAIRESAGAFVLDLCELEFLDSSGLNLMLRARVTLARERRTLAIVCPPGPVRRVMEITSLDDVLLLYDSHADLAAALIPPD